MIFLALLGKQDCGVARWHLLPRVARRRGNQSCSSADAAIMHSGDGEDGLQGVHRTDGRAPVAHHHGQRPRASAGRR